eukprot:gene31176-6319_t
MAGAMDNPLARLVASRGICPPGHISTDPCSTTQVSCKAAAAAAAAMDNPLPRLMASRGMPLGISPQTVSGRSSVPFPEDELEKPKPEPGYTMEALDELIPNAAAAAGDSWGTTREGPAEIARRIMLSNANAAEDDVLPDPNDDELKLSPSEAKYKTLEEMSEDIKALDEVFEVLASVPWMDDMDMSQKEMKGVAMFGLLGTLEEVGFNIKDKVHQIWAGQHDQSLAMGCPYAKDQAALISILFHTKKLEEESLAMGCPNAKDQAALISILFHTKKLEEEDYGAGLQGLNGPCLALETLGHEDTVSKAVSAFLNLPPSKASGV